MSSPDWTELCLEIAVEDTDRAAAIANMAVPYGIYIEDYSDLEQGARDIAHIDLIDEELLARDRTRALIHLYISPEDNPAEAAAYLRERLTAEGIRHELKDRQVKEDDWANGWKQYFKPLPVGKRLLIRPTWEEAGDPGGRQVLSIDPGMAFGTGGHETTRLVLETLEELVFPGAELLDVGCGSGILSIAALLLGASRTVGVDIDPLAVKTAEENGRINGFTPLHRKNREPGPGCGGNLRRGGRQHCGGRHYRPVAGGPPFSEAGGRVCHVRHHRHTGAGGIGNAGALRPDAYRTKGSQGLAVSDGPTPVTERKRMRWRSTTGWTIWAFICSSPCATSAATGSCTAPGRDGS